VQLETGTVLNQIYRVVRLLGSGAMGNVYLVERIKDDEKFVVKELLFTEKTGMDADTAREIFFREADFMVRFKHCGIPAMHGIFSQASKEYLVMDYVEGRTLEEIITSSPGPLSQEKSIQWTIELAKIMDYLHNSFHKPVVYKDLKPSNIIITPEGYVKLVDFGIARYYNPDKNTDTFSFGSPGYAAPEQYKGKGQSSPQTDIFGLGVILFQMLTKYDPTIKPFTFPSMKSLNPDISGKLEEIVTRAIQLNPLKRYISMVEFCEALERYAGITEKAYSYASSSAPPLSSGSLTIILIIAGVFVVSMFGGQMCYLPIAGLLAVFFISYAIVFIIYYPSLHLINYIFKKEYRVNSNFPVPYSIILSIIFILAAILIPNFLKSKSGGYLAACESNLKNIATALEMYATDNEGYYPPSLEYLKMNITPSGGSYVKWLPLCPSCKKPYNYEYADHPDNFTLCCGGGQAHIATGTVSSEGYWPQYTPGKGIELK